MQSSRQIILALGIAGTLFASDPFAGTWKLDTARSSGTLPKGETLIVKQDGQILAVEVRVFDADPDHPATTIRYTVPVAGGHGHVESGPYDGVLIRRINPTALALTYLNHGKKVISSRGTLSKDGQTMVTKAKAGKSAWTMVLERQPDLP